MAFIGDCRLCLSTGVELRDSHIIPELLYKRVYTAKHKFIPISINNDNLKIEQKGYREKLLCQVCETKLSVWENELSKFLDELIDGRHTNIKVTQLNECYIVNSIDYDKIKKAILSIFWRMSIAKNDLFSCYSLGKYDEKFRDILYQDILIDYTIYPVLISKGLLKEKFHAGILFPISRGRYGNRLIMQSVVLNGFVFYLLMVENRSIPEEINLFSLKPSGYGGQVIILERPYNELGLNIDDFSNRMRQSDVKEFYDKH